jgi:hypothetical protein
MTQDEIIEMAREAGFFVKDSEAYSPSVQEDHELTPYLETFSKLIAAKEREKIKHFLTATSVSVQSRVYIGNEEISMLKMTHEEIRARGGA